MPFKFQACHADWGVWITGAACHTNIPQASLYRAVSSLELDLVYSLMYEGPAAGCRLVSTDTPHKRVSSVVLA